MKKQFVVIAIVIGVLVIFGAGWWAGFTIARESGQLICTSNPCRITMTRNGESGLVIKDAAGPREENPLLIIDPHGLAEFWQNAKGAYEGPKGEIGFFLISDGGPNPYRYRVRPPSLINLTILEDMCLGHNVADVVLIFGSVDIVLGEVDR